MQSLSSGCLVHPNLGLQVLPLPLHPQDLRNYWDALLFPSSVKMCGWSPRFIFVRSKSLLKDFIRLSLPALGNDVSWGVGFAMYSVILGHLGSDAVAANSLVTVVRNIGSVFCYGIASAGTIMLGKTMGEGKLAQSKEYASRMLKATVVASIFGGLAVLAVSPLIMRFAFLNDTAMHYLKYMLLINSYYITGSAVNTALIAGIFRAGGDTKFGLIC